MSAPDVDAYRVSKLFYRLGIDAAFLERVRGDFDAVAAELGLTETEKDLVRHADLRALYTAGVHPFLLSSYTRHGLFGMDRAAYRKRIEKVARGPRPWSRP